MTTTTVPLPVSVAAIADSPVLTVQAASGDENSAIALNIAAALSDTDGSELLSDVTISGIPAGTTLSVGTLNPDDTVTLTQAELAGLTITPPPDSDVDFTLSVSATATEGAGGDTATATVALPVSVVPVDSNITFVGGDGDDSFTGGIGDDLLFGGGGSDTLAGGAGADTLYAGDFENLLRNSESFGAGTAWSSAAVTMSAGGAAPGGTEISTLLSGTSEGNGRIWQLVDGLEAGGTYTLSFWHHGDNMRMAAAALDFATNLDTVFVGASSTWQQVSLTVTLGASETGFYFQLGGGGQLGLGNSAEIWGLQINTGVSAGGYVATGDTPVVAVADTAPNTLFGNAGADTLHGAAGSDLLHGGDGSDRLFGNRGDDFLLGGAGDDFLSGGAGVDTLFGGAGDDTLDGGAGDDVSLITAGDGFDVIDGFGAGDRIDLLAQPAAGTIEDVFAAATDDGVNTTISFGNGDGLRLNGVRLADLSADDFILPPVITDDITFVGGLGDDTFAGGIGNDTLDGGGGNDRLFGGAGADTLIGGAGAASLYGDGLMNLLRNSESFGAGTAWDSWAVTMAAGGPGPAGTGTATALAGMDAGNGRVYQLVDGLTGGETYTLSFWHRGDGFRTTATAEGFGSNLAIAQVSASSEWQHVELSFTLGATDSGFYFFVGGGGGFNLGNSAEIWGAQVNTGVSAGGYVATTNEPAGTVIDTATNLLIGGDGDDTLTGAAGDDLLFGGGGSDTLAGGAGADTLYAGDFENLIRNSESFGAGTAWNSWAVTMADGGPGPGGTGTATALSGTDAGNGRVYQLVDGLTGGETYTLSFWHRGDGFRTTATAEGFGSNLATLQVSASSEWQQVELSFTLGATDSSFYFFIGGGGQFNLGNSAEIWGAQVNTGRAAGGYVATGDTPIAAAADTTPNTLFGDAGADTLHGAAGSDLLSGGEGSDRLFGNRGDDVLQGGAGDDTLDGGAGDDVFVIAAGDGFDVIDGFGAGDRIDLLGQPAAGTIEDVLAAATDDGVNTTISFGNGDGLRLNGVRLADLSTDNFILPPISDITFVGGLGDDTFAGGIGDDTLDGGGGNDLLFGGAGSGTLIGGAGSDTLFGDGLMNLLRNSESFGAGTAWDSWAVTMAAGGPGPAGTGTATALAGMDAGNGRVYQLVDGLTAGETYTLSFWHRGDGFRTTATAEGFGSNLAIAQVSASSDWQQVELSFTLGATDSGFYFFIGGGGQFNLGNSAEIWGAQVNTGGAAGEYVATTNVPVGTEIDTAADLLIGGDGDDTLTGAAGDDTLDGGAGNDILDGGAGNDVFVIAAGDGADVIQGFVAGSTAGDWIDLGGQPAIADFAALLAAATDDGANTTISFGNGDALTLLGVRKLDLTADDFSFDGSPPIGPAGAVESIGDSELAGGSETETLAGGGDKAKVGVGDDILSGGGGAEMILFDFDSSAELVGNFSSDQSVKSDEPAPNLADFLAVQSAPSSDAVLDLGGDDGAALIVVQETALASDDFFFG